MKAIRNLTVGLAVVGLLGLISSAQPASEDQEEAPLAKAGGETVTLEGGQNVSLGELLQKWVEATGEKLIYDPRKVQGDIFLHAPKAGAQMSISDLLNVALGQYRLCLIKTGEFYEILPTAEASTSARRVTLEELAKAPAGEFVCVLVPLVNCEGNAMRGATQNLMSRQGGMCTPIGSGFRPSANTLLLCDTAGNLKRVVAMIQELDATPVSTTVVLRLSHARVEDIQPALASAGEVAGELSVRVLAVPASNQLIMTGPPGSVERLRHVVVALDVKTE